MVYLRDFLSFLGKRALGALAIMFGVVVIVFLISHLLNPDPAALWAGEKARVTTVAAIKAEYHLTQPLDARRVVQCECSLQRVSGGIDAARNDANIVCQACCKLSQHFVASDNP